MKSLIDFDDDQANSIKSLAIEVKSNVAITTTIQERKNTYVWKNFLERCCLND